MCCPHLIAIGSGPMIDTGALNGEPHGHRSLVFPARPSPRSIKWCISKRVGAPSAGEVTSFYVDLLPTYSFAKWPPCSGDVRGPKIQLRCSAEYRLDEEGGIPLDEKREPMLYHAVEGASKCVKQGCPS